MICIYLVALRELARVSASFGNPIHHPSDQLLTWLPAEIGQLVNERQNGRDILSLIGSQSPLSIDDLWSIPPPQTDSHHQRQTASPPQND